jgi:methylphosphotriester-DNA--protein-cysteine methyltransferase
VLHHTSIPAKELRAKIKRKEITMGGNRKLKIYGHLSCVSGRRMNKQTRVFFHTETEALQKGYRPCAKCLSKKYQQWISFKFLA